MRRKIALTAAAAAMLVAASPTTAFAQQYNSTVSNQSSTQTVGESNVPGFVGQFVDQRQLVDQSNSPSGGGFSGNFAGQSAGSGVGDVRGTGGGVSLRVIQNTDQSSASFQRGGAEGPGPAAQRNDAVLGQDSVQSTRAGSVQVQDLNQDQLVNQRNFAPSPAEQQNNAATGQGSLQFQSGGAFQLQRADQSQLAHQLNVIFGDGGPDDVQSNFFAPSQFAGQGQFSPFAVFQDQILIQDSVSEQDNRFFPEAH